jgi:hypothetical protein
MHGHKAPIVALEYPGGRGGGMDSERYINQVLKGAFMEFYMQMSEERGIVVYQQDSALMHTSKRTTKWLEAHHVPPMSTQLSHAGGSSRRVSGPSLFSPTL